MKKHLWIVSISLYGLALFSPFYATAEWPLSGLGNGWGMLLIGWIEPVLHGGADLAWFANPIYIVALCTSKKYPIISVGFALTSIPVALVYLKSQEIWSNEMGNLASLNKIKIGYWFWLASMVVILVAAIFEIVERRKRGNKSF